MVNEEKVQYEREHQVIRLRKAASDACEAARILNVLHDPSKADNNELDKLLGDAQDLSSAAAAIIPGREGPN